MVEKSTSTLRYMNAEVGRDERKVVFYQVQSEDLVSDSQRFYKKSVSFFENGERRNKN